MFEYFLLPKIIPPVLKNRNAFGKLAKKVKKKKKNDFRQKKISKYN